MANNKIDSRCESMRQWKNIAKVISTNLHENFYDRVICGLANQWCLTAYKLVIYIYFSGTGDNTV